MNKILISCTFTLAIALGLGSSQALAADPVRIYIANDDHTDYMWTADEEAYRKIFIQMLDYYLDLTDRTMGNPSPYQSRFNCDGSLWLWVYEHNKTPAEFARLIGRVRDGHISAPLNAATSCYGGQPAEAVLRGMYYAGQLERRHGLRFPMAVAMENQTLPLGLASLWAGAGARHSWRGVCDCASRLSGDFHRREHEIYWYTGQDGQRVLLKWYSLAPGGNQVIGGYAEAFNPIAAIKYLDTNSDFLNRYSASGAGRPYDLCGAFGFGWDAPARMTGVPSKNKNFPECPHFHVIAQAQSNEHRQVIVSNEEDFFRDFEARYGARLPSESVTYGNEWDLYSASMAETSARVRRAVEKLRAAEAMATLVSLKRSGFMRDRAAARDRAFLDLGLYWEHCWTADGPVKREARAAWQERLAGEIEDYVNTLYADGVTQLGQIIENDGQGERFYVFNPLGWTRTDIADFTYDGPIGIHVRDLVTGKNVPHQFMTRNGKKSLRILARDLPPMGYNVYEIQPGADSESMDAAAKVTVGHSGEATLENSRVKLILQPDGAIRSLRDKRRNGVERAGSIGGIGLNDLAANDASGEAIAIENSGPVSLTLKCVSSAGKRHVTRVTLIRDSDRVDIRNEITQNFSDVRHWGFSFNLASPDVHTEEIGAVIRAKKKREGGDYANTLARYDYLTLNHFADISDGANGGGMTLSNADCSFAQLGASTPDQLDTATPQLNVLAGGQVDGAKLGIPNQNGAAYFLQRFALRPHGGYDAVEAMKFSLEHQNPPVTGRISGAKGSPYPGRTCSMLAIDRPGVLLWAFKPAEEGIGQGIITRLWNLNAAPTDCSIEIKAPGCVLASARQTTHIETDLKAIPVSEGKALAAIAGRQLLSLRLIPGPEKH